MAQWVKMLATKAGRLKFDSQGPQGWSVWFRRELPEGLTTYSWPFKEDLRLPMPPTPVAKDVTSRADAGAGPSCAAPWAEAEGAGLAERTL